MIGLMCTPHYFTASLQNHSYAKLPTNKLCLSIECFFFLTSTFVPSSSLATLQLCVHQRNFFQNVIHNEYTHTGTSKGSSPNVLYYSSMFN